MKTALVVIGAAIGIAGCSQFVLPRIEAGAAATDVRARAGAPTEMRTLADGAKAWYYVHGPLGFTTYRVTFDGADRVARVEQVLEQRRFERLEPHKWNRDEILAQFGRPAETTRFPMRNEEVWTYRFKDVGWYKLADVYFDGPAGRAKYVTIYVDPGYHGGQVE